MCGKSDSNDNNTLLGLAYLLLNQPITEKANIEVKGIIKDSNESTMTDATLTVSKEASNSVKATSTETTTVTTSTTTDSNGEFTIYLRVGKYKITVYKDGSEVGSFVLQPENLLYQLEPTEINGLFVFITQALVINDDTNLLLNFFEFGSFTKLSGTGSGTYTEPNSITTDSLGNIYTTGYTTGSLDGNTITGDSDMFITKYDLNGNKKWTKQFGVSNVDTNGSGVATDNFGNVYVTGTTYGGLDGNTQIGYWDGYIMKFNPSGNKQWTKQFGVSNYGSTSTSIIIDSSTNIYIAGSIGTDSGTYSLLIKFDYNGNQQWMQQGSYQSSSHLIDVTSLALDSSNNIYITGYTDINLEDGIDLGSTMDFFITKYDSSGNKVWLNQSTILNVSSGIYPKIDVSLDGSDNIFVSGVTEYSLGGNTLTGATDAFVMKYDTNGTQVWVKQIGVSSYDTHGYGVTTDIFGNAYITGYTTGGLPGYSLIGSDDAFVVKYNSSGELISVKQKGVNSYSTSGSDIALDSLGNPIVVGGTDGNLDGESHSGGGVDAFITTNW